MSENFSHHVRRESHLKNPDPHYDFLCGSRHCASEKKSWSQRITERVGLVLCGEGKGMVRFENRDVDVLPSDLLLLKPGVPHSFHPGEGWSFQWFHFPVRPHITEALSWPEVIRGVGKVHLEPEEFRRAKSALEEALFLDLRRPRNWCDLALILVESVLIRGYNQNISESAGIGRMVLRAQQMLTESNDSVDEIAERCGVSRAGLYQKFKDAVGVSPRQYREDTRLRRAVQLLALPEYSISEIAQQVGMPDAYYFSTRFRRAFGQPPREFRKKILER
ncbi:helix-turn-helix domain-containing protein [Puniceicoccus vermicola]|uniref:Helix-turn-helix domain-containing protein n=1 Tax=Puniceicoccus vermicola TaxID=388746 RepID=A0A7X1AXI8_9BACT|nr:helix-turn-helix domain-containing protein [Puniceicoccus vermicola]MBC2601584.1 helix-turn-helix domain-containing protein [Puniceicoccus vermicola]